MCESRLENVSASQLNVILRALLILAGCGVLFVIAMVAFR